MTTRRSDFVVSMAVVRAVCLVVLTCAAASPVLAGNDSTPETRWRIADGGKRIVWDVAHDARLPHGDRFEMSGLRASLIFSYDVAGDKSLALGRKVVWPAYRVQPNNTHGSFAYKFSEKKVPRLTADGKPCGEIVDAISFDGVWRAESRSADGSLRIVRSVFPSVDKAAAFEWIEVENAGNEPRKVGITKDFADYALGCTGRYEVRAQAFPSGIRALAPGEKGTWTLRLSARRVDEPDCPADGAAELAARVKRVEQLTSPIVLDTGIPEIDTAFHFAKIRAGESIFATRTGIVHSPGGGSYYAASWCNDQVEYANPWFAFTGDALALEASMNAYRHYVPFMGPRYEPIPSSVIAEGLDYWNGKGDRGDAAMFAYGATRFVLAAGRRDWAEELLPAIRWSLEYCRRQLNEAGVVKSNCDELELRLPAGDANLCTSSLYYDALRHAAMLEKELGNAEAASDDAARAAKMSEAIERHFGCDMRGFHTYRYYEGCKVLRSWIGIPLCMGIYDRARGTTDAIFSPALWTGMGMLCAEGDKKGVTWDRSVLYAFRGVFAAGLGDDVMDKFLAYSRSRLLGEHVPYPVEAWPEGGKRHLSAESALYCRIVTEGLFGIEPTGLGTFDVKPHLPKGVKRMSLKNIRAFGREFDIVVDGTGTRIVEGDKNPIIEGWYADPQIRKYGDRYWVFPTVSDSFRKETFFDAFSSSDLKTWKKHPRILTTNEVTWARGAMWAPDAHEVDGKYYFFFSANDTYPVSGQREDGEPKKQPSLQGYGGIGVAVADRPEGPYRDLIGKPLIDRFWNGAQPIDQYVFEYKGDWYMVYGGWGRCNLVKLARDFKSLVPFEDGSLWRNFTPKGYVEGSVMFERKGKWYFMYSCGGWTRDDYCVNYSVGDTPFGPFEFKGKVLGVKRPIATGAGHHSVIRVGEDDWRICYHRRPIPSKSPHHRVVCIDRMEFDENGDIKPVEMTK